MKVAIVGAGYVGLVTAVSLTKQGHTVCCVETDADRLATIASGEIPFHEPGLGELLRTAFASERFTATDEIAAAVESSDCSMVAVGTPERGGRMDLAALMTAVREIGEARRTSDSYHVVAVRSTVPPGTTEGPVATELQNSSQKSAHEIGLCVNPEFLREGTAIADAVHPDRVVIGQRDARSGDALAQLYEGASCPVIRTSLANAETIKCVSNSLLATMISFGNEVAGLCEATPGTDAHAVVSAIALDRRFHAGGQSGPAEIVHYLKPGIGFGGSCLPKDLSALRAYAAERGVPTPLLDSVSLVNERRTRHVIDMLTEHLGELAGTEIAVLGLAFKPGTDDVRESPALTLIQGLAAAGARLRAYDPMVGRSQLGGLVHDEVAIATSIAEAVDGSSAIVVATGWSEFAKLHEYDLEGHGVQIVLDGRDVLRPEQFPESVPCLKVGVNQNGCDV